MSWISIFCIVLTNAIWCGLFFYEKNRKKKCDRDGELIFDPANPNGSTLRLNTQVDRLIRDGYVLLDVYLKTD